MMEKNQLEQFVTVVESGSISKAAKILYLAQPNLSKTMQLLEEEMGQKLTIVATGGLAKALIPHCRHDIILDDALLLKGLKIIYDKNH